MTLQFPTAALRRGSWAVPILACVTAFAGAQEQVGVVGHNVPEEAQYILRATVPVPRSEFDPTWVQDPFSIQLDNGTIVPTQIEIVSRYPKADDGVDIMEVIALVERPSEADPGDWVEYKLVENPHSSGSPELHPDSQALIDTPGSVTLTSHDLFGHEYSLDVLGRMRAGVAKVKKQGRLLQEEFAHEVLMPVESVSGPSGTMPHLMGAHIYVTRYKGTPMMSLDMHIHNGMDGQIGVAQDVVLDELYFADLALNVPSGWQVMQSYDAPSLGDMEIGVDGNTINLVEPLPGSDTDDKHWMPRQGRFIRRLMLYPDGFEDQARDVLDCKHLAFCRPGTRPNGEQNWSWWSTRTSRYFAQRTRLPLLQHLDHPQERASLEQDLAFYEDRVATGSDGSYPMPSGALGWAHPWSVAYGGITGGNEIHHYDGILTALTGSQEGYRFHQLVSRCYADRQPTSLYRLDGRPMQVWDVLEVNNQGQTYMPGNFFLRPSTNPDWIGFSSAPQHQMDAAIASSADPSYRKMLKAFQPIDMQHYIRFTRTFKILAWIGNDSLAKDVLAQTAAAFRLSYHEHFNSSNGYVQDTGMLSDLIEVSEFPASGVSLGRGEGWGLDANIATYAFGDDTIRAQLEPWLRRISQLMINAQSNCTGNLMSYRLNKKEWKRFRVRQSIEVGIMDGAIRGLLETVYRREDPILANRLKQLLVDNVRASLSAPYWNTNGVIGPWRVCATGTWDPQFIPDLCTNVPPAGFSQLIDRDGYWNSFAYAYELTNDDFFLQRAAQMSTGGSIQAELFDPNNPRVEHRMALISLLELLQSN